MIQKQEIDLAIELLNKGQFSQAVDVLNSIKTKDIHILRKILYLKALSFDSLKKYDQAIKNYYNLIDIDKLNLPSHFNLGNIFLKIEQIDKAELFFKRCLAIDKNFEPALVNLTSIYLKQKRFKENIDLLKNDLYQNQTLNFNKLISFLETKNHIEFLQFYRKINNNFDLSENEKSKFLNLIGIYFKNFSKHKAAALYFKKSLKYEFNHLTNNNYLSCKILLDLENNLTKKEKNITTSLPISNKVQYLKKSKKIRMGFISSDFREHAVNYQLFDFFSLLAKDDKFILDFFYNYHTNDHLTNKLKSQIKNWSNIFFQNDEDIFQNIKDKQLDFLIDLNGLSDGNRNAIFDNKPAPCLINWCGWLTSTFNKNFDYILGDSFVFSGSQKDDYFENALSMPRIWSTLSKSLIKNKPNKIKNIKNEKSVFICPQRYDKINEEVILCWKDIVNSDSTKELYLSNNCYADPFILQKILKKFKYYDCNINKIKFFYNNDRFRSLEIYKKADIALDTFPYSGGTTTFELLYLNIPVVTLKGNHFISNTSYSLNMNLKLDHCVANSASDYTSKSIELSKNPKLYLDVQNQIIKKIHKDDFFSSSYFYKDFVSLFL